MSDIHGSDLCLSDNEDPDELATLLDNTLCSLLDPRTSVKCKNITLRLAK